MYSIKNNDGKTEKDLSFFPESLQLEVYVGCFKDRSPRGFPHKPITSGSMTVAECAVNCENYMYMGLQVKSINKTSTIYI